MEKNVKWDLYYSNVFCSNSVYAEFILQKEAHVK